MDNSNPHEIIPISFTLKSPVGNHFYQINNEINQPKTSKYLIQTSSQAKSSGIKVLEIHDMNKGLNPHVKLGKQRPLSTLPMHSIPPTLLVQPVDKVGGILCIGNVDNGLCLPSLTCGFRPPTLLVQPVDKGPPTHPIPKPRIGQGRAGLK